MKTYGGQTMVGPLLRTLVCSPAAAGWDSAARAARWQELGFRHTPDFETAGREHRGLLEALAAAGSEVCFISEGGLLGLDAVYAHDASFFTDAGAVCLRMGKPQRREEPPLHRAWCSAAGIPVVGEIHEPGTVEAGDIVWLDEQTLLIGRGYRTNKSGIAQMKEILSAFGISVLQAPLPHAGGPDGCLHLMSLLSVLDPRNILVDLPWLAVETLELLRHRGFRLIEIDYSERATLACNVLALGNGTLLAFKENANTNHRLVDAGYRVLTLPGGEIGINGGGGPTCLTRPILRAVS